MTGEYAAYVASAYAIGAGSLLAVLLWAVLDRRAARKGLARAERAATRASRKPGAHHGA